MNGLNQAQRQYDNMQHPDYYDTRSDAELEEIWAQEAAEKKRSDENRICQASYVRNDALWDAVTAKRLAQQNAV